MPSIISIISNPFMIRAVIAIVLIGVISATAGSMATFRGLSFFVVGIAHSALAGAALMILLDQYGIVRGINPIFGAIAFCLLVALVVGLSESESLERLETTIGVVFAFSMSLALLFISLMREYSVEAWALILGDILLLTEKDIIILTITTVVVSFLFIIFLREFIFISFDPEGSRAIGVNVRLYHILMLVLIAVSTVVLLKGIGAILVYVVLIVPPTIANRIGKNVTHVMMTSFIISIISGMCGLLLSLVIAAAPSALIGLILTVVYFVFIRWHKSS